jgi:hypothetical protein
MYFIKFFRNVKNTLNYDVIVDLQHVICLTTEESSAECTIMCRNGSKMYTK